MNDLELLARRNRFVSYVIWVMFPFMTESVQMIWVGIPFCIAIFIASRFKKHPTIVMYIIITLSSSYMFVKTIIDDAFLEWVFVFIFFSISILFQRVSAILLSLVYSLFITFYFWSTLDTEAAKIIADDHMPFAHFLFTFAMTAFLFINQVLINKKLQKKSEVENINARKGRKKVNIVLEKLKESAKSISNFSSNLNENVVNLKSYSEDATNTFEEMNQSFVQQNENLKVIDNKIVNINDNIQQATESSTYMLKVLEATSESTSKGYSQLKDLEKEIAEVDVTISTLGKTMIDLNERNNDISNILTFISEISQKTNVLALNATIEAARAGEHGRGFKVVSDEVKNLAKLTNESTKEIEKILKTITKQTKMAVVQTENSEKTVGNSKNVLQNLSSVFDKILTNTNDTVDHSIQVSDMIKVLSESSEEIVQQIIALTDMNEENTKEVENIFSIIQKQNEKIHKISDEFFKLKESVENLSEEK